MQVASKLLTFLLHAEKLNHVLVLFVKRFQIKTCFSQIAGVAMGQETQKQQDGKQFAFVRLDSSLTSVRKRKV